MISGTQVLARMSDTVNQDQLNRRGLLVERARQLSAKMDDIERKLAKAPAHKLETLRSLLCRVEAEYTSVISLMHEGRFVQPTTRSVSARVKTELERKQGKAYSKAELYGAVTMGTGKALP